jgi:hypothetical protein
MQIQRKSYFEINRIYFFTATIHQWLPLLSSKENKELIINYLKELSARDLIKIYSFVIVIIIFFIFNRRQYRADSPLLPPHRQYFSVSGNPN